jgi:phosphocarrier protein FPr
MSTPVGLVVVSHSHALATAAVELAREMAPADLPIVVAAGLDGGFGTDAVAIAAAIQEADRGAGVVVLMDLGSAVLSAETALEFLPDPDRVLLCPAPLVEGLVVAAVTAGGGADRATVAAEANRALAAKLDQLGDPTDTDTGTASPAPIEDAPGERRATFVVTTPNGLHARPAARLVALVRRLDGAQVRLRNRTTGSDPTPADSVTGVALLGAQPGHELEVSATGPAAEAAVAAVLELAARHFDETPAAAGTPEPTPAEGSAARPGSPGTGIGPARVLVVAAREVPDAPPSDPAAEHARLDAALATARTGITATRDSTERRLGRPAAAIFDAHLALLDDPVLVGITRAGIDDGRSAAAAWAGAVDGSARRLAAIADETLAARAADVRAVGDQVLAALLGSGSGGQPVSADASAVVLVAADLTPAQVVELDPARVAGVVLAGGAPTSHAVLLLRAHGIPAVVGAGPAVLDLPDGTPVALDGGTGELAIDPDPDRLTAFSARAATEERRARAARERSGEPAVTRDGVEVLVGANIGAVADAAAAADAGADLAGLVRTEFLFLDRTRPPDVDEQVAAYRAVAAALGGRRITLRTLDVGGDKPLSYLPLPAQANPFLGLRGIRLAGTAGGLLRDQLRAAVRVAHETPVSLMFPMVSALEEVLAARRELDAVIAAEGRGSPAGLRVGIMVEVPAAALKAAVIVPQVDFLSIGTNDLTQYTLAVERGNPAVADLADPLDPAVLRLVDVVCRAAAGRVPVAVCGEAAADPVAAGLLVGLGVRELSVVAPAVAGVKQAVRALDVAEAARRAAAALALAGPAEVRQICSVPGSAVTP